MSNRAHTVHSILLFVEHYFVVRIQNNLLILHFIKILELISNVVLIIYVFIYFVQLDFSGSSIFKRFYFYFT
jgi:hypothetical protein